VAYHNRCTPPADRRKTGRLPPPARASDGVPVLRALPAHDACARTSPFPHAHETARVRRAAACSDSRIGDRTARQVLQPAPPTSTAARASSPAASDQRCRARQRLSSASPRRLLSTSRFEPRRHASGACGSRSPKAAPAA
jgi:hypothetical protein